MDGGGLKTGPRLIRATGRAEAFLAFTVRGGLPVTKLVAGLIGAVELKGIFENLDGITNGAIFRAVIERLAPENVAKNGLK